MCVALTQLHQPQTLCTTSRTFLNPSFLSVSIPVLAQGSCPSCNPCIRANSGCASDVTPHSHSPRVEIPCFLNILFFLWCLFWKQPLLQVSLCLSKGFQGLSLPPPPVYPLISLTALDTADLQPYLQSLDTFVCILLPLMFNEGSGIMVLEKPSTQTE